MLIKIALASATIAFLVPIGWTQALAENRGAVRRDRARRFAIQGALYATEMKHPLGAVIVAAMLSGIGGGVIRDLLAGRKPTRVEG